MSIISGNPQALATCTALALLAGVPTAAAQLMLEEVIVTAQKRTESLQDVPVSVSAIQGSKIQDAGIPNMAALADYVPNLFISDAPVSTNIYMRGMGSSNNQAFEQSVGMYIDGIYMGRGRQYRAPFMDIERVEVLRGPQGTLFGRNTVAGAISVITASPDLDEEFNGRMDFSAETNDGYIGEGMVSGSVSDTLALRIAGRYRQTDGYVENTFLDADEPAIDEWNYRFTTVWAPSDNLDVNFKWSQSNLEREGVASGVTLYADPATRDSLFPNRDAFADIAYSLTDTFYPQFPNEVAEEFTIFKDNNLGPAAGANGVVVGQRQESSDQDTDNAALNLNYALGEYDITAITGYSAYEYLDGCDCDWLPLQFIARDDDQEFDQWSQELRIASPTGGFFDYIAGAYYESNTVQFDRRVTIDTNLGGLVEQQLGVGSLLTLLTGGAYNANQLARNHAYEQDTESWAVFGQGTFHLREDLRLTLGLRYTEETKEVESSQFISDDLTGIDKRTDNFFALQIEATEFNTYVYDYDEDRKTDEILPAANLQWDVTDNSMLYLSYSEGFKSGGFTAADDGNPGGIDQATWPCAPGQIPEDCYDVTAPNEDFEFDDESVVAYEIGGKHTLLSGAMTLNWAAFYTEYDDLQTSIFQGVSFSVTNAAEAEIKGIELDMLWQATEGLRLGLNGAWLDSEYTSYETAPCTAVQLDIDPLCGSPLGTTSNDLSGENTTFAPEYTASGFFDYSHLLGNGMELFGGGEINYSDSFDTQGDLDPDDRADDYTKINLRIGLRGAEQQWEVMLYGRNITDEQALVYSFDVPVLVGSHAAMIDEGEVYGARLRYQF
ncbi:MAG: TonB-dependent receptor [Halioglobus sp.]|nr:TonB-dependent receptor [Halioglobus sp.]